MVIMERQTVVGLSRVRASGSIFYMQKHDNSGRAHSLCLFGRRDNRTVVVGRACRLPFTVVAARPPFWYQ